MGKPRHLEGIATAGQRVPENAIDVGGNAFRRISRHHFVEGTNSLHLREIRGSVVGSFLKFESWREMNEWLFVVRKDGLILDQFGQLVLRQQLRIIVLLGTSDNSLQNALAVRFIETEVEIARHDLHRHSFLSLRQNDRDRNSPSL